MDNTENKAIEKNPDEKIDNQNLSTQEQSSGSNGCFNINHLRNLAIENEKINNILKSEFQPMPTNTDTKANEQNCFHPEQPSCSNGGFNANQLWALASINEKVNNILKSPKTTAALSPKSSRYNISAEPFVPQCQRAHVTDTPSFSEMRNMPTSTPHGRLTARPLFMQMSPAAVQHYKGHDITPPRPHTAGGGYIYQSVPIQFSPICYGGNHKDLNRMFPQPMPPPPPFASKALGATGYESHKDCSTPASLGVSRPIAMANGTIQLRLRDGVRIDMTLDKSIRVFNERTMVAIGLSRNYTASAFIHPNGRILQTGTKVDIVTYDAMEKNNYVRYAKMWYKGISFTSDVCALVYLVDTAGTRTTTDTFTDLTKDYTLAVFYENTRHGPTYYQEACDVIQQGLYHCNEDGAEIYDLNGFRIFQGADGLVKPIVQIGPYLGIADYLVVNCEISAKGEDRRFTYSRCRLYRGSSAVTGFMHHIDPCCFVIHLP
ncbi:uncharacterized protein LOC106088926 isoform X2 [Stomoxys calcitrans]|uniref:uncharacterized protein LOC106088926 isoform X2 n=1 Tax=Stomoxys calcitrans TaxID=35570 RepID=UPI0027E2F23A|nr:uncharacterized protein LOC106088926 isoform X2 [Stomoxys calcitrans]